METGKRGEIRPLTGIRGIAALWVVIFHFYEPFCALLPGFAHLEPLVRFGNLGVDLFFLLSGFILSYVYQLGTSSPSCREYCRFLWTRFARVYPNHLVTLLLIAVMVLVAHWMGRKLGGVYTATGFADQLALLQAWPWFDAGQWNYPSWSVSAEWFAYVFMFPVAWVAMRRERPVGWWLGAMIACLLVWILASLIPALASVHTLLRVSCEFLGGCCLYMIYSRQLAVSAFCQRHVTALALVIAIGLIAGAAHPFLTSCIAIFTFPWLLLGLTAESSAVSVALATRPALWLGNLSYALYMSHAVVQKLLGLVLPVRTFAHADPLTRCGVFVTYWICLIGAAAILCYAVEIPARRFLREHRPRFAFRLPLLFGAVMRSLARPIRP